MSDDGSSGLVQGSVKWFNKEKGYGFAVVPGYTRDIFLHIKKMKTSGIQEPLLEGESISFKIEQGPKGDFATDIVKVA